MPTYFAWTVYQNNIPQNIATWLMFFLLDFLGLVLVFRAGNKKPYVQLGWAVASVCILTAIALGESPWHWGWMETASLILCGIAIVFWLALNAKVAIWPYLIAMYISAIPLMVDYWKEPQIQTLWLWSSTVVICLMAIYGAERRDFANTVIPWAALILNAIIAILCIL
ncbi:MAG: hypothetical protein WAV46_02210 [Candidatus Moraniibacteriota bacterium]